MPQKWNLTLSVYRPNLNHGSRRVVIFTAPSNSRLIRETSSSTRRRSFAMTPVVFTRGGISKELATKLSLMAYKRGEVAGLSVERAIEIQGSPPPTQPIPKSTSWRFGNLEKSKDRWKASRASTSGDNVSDNASRARSGGGGYHGRRWCTTALRGSCNTLLRVLHSGGGTRTYCGYTPL